MYNIVAVATSYSYSKEYLCDYNLGLLVLLFSHVATCGFTFEVILLKWMNLFCYTTIYTLAIQL